MKQMFLSILLIFSLSFFYGFTPLPDENISEDYIMLSLNFSSRGEIVQSFDFNINSARVSLLSKNVKEEIDFKNNLIKQVGLIRNEFLFSFALIYIQNPIEEYKINKGVKLSQVSINQDNDSVGFKIYFENDGVWNYYHKVKSQENNKKDDKRNIFINKVESSGVFPFASEIQLNENEKTTVAQRYKNLYLESAKNLSFYQNLIEIYKPNFIYNYSVLNNKIRSNCDYMFVDNLRYNHHVWIRQEDIIKDNTICIYLYSIEKGVWLIFATILPLIFLGVYIVAIKFGNKRK